MKALGVYLVLVLSHDCMISILMMASRVPIEQQDVGNYDYCSMTKTSGTHDFAMWFQFQRSMLHTPNKLHRAPYQASSL